MRVYASQERGDPCGYHPTLATGVTATDLEHLRAWQIVGRVPLFPAALALKIAVYLIEQEHNGEKEQRHGELQEASG